MKNKTKKFLITALSAVTLSCCVLGATNYADNSNVALAEEASTTVIRLVDGASCRIRTESDSEEGSGIRFKAVLNRTKWDALAKSYEMTAGIMIFPTEYIKAAGGYTHSELKSAGKNYLDFTYTEEEVGEKTILAASMVDILDQNYTRDFSGVAYVKSTSMFEGATKYNGAYYAYAAYSEENNSRSVYEIASRAYNDRKSSQITEDYENKVIFNDGISYSPYRDDQRDVLKEYLDSVVDIKKNAYADIFVANNTEYYTSPYTVDKKTEREFVIAYNSDTFTAKSILYNGERKKEWPLEDGRTQVSLIGDEKVSIEEIFSSDAILNDDGSVTLTGGSVANTGWKSGCQDILTNLGYVAFEGEYGVGTYMDFTFMGNNMPMVTFFANNINRQFTRGGNASDAPTNTGMLIMNGMYTTAYSPNVQYDYLSIWGPNRYLGLGAANTNGNATVDTNFAYGQTKLVAGTTYHYTVGTYETADGYVGVHVILKDASNTVLYEKEIKTHVLASVVTADNIIVFSGITGASTTSFTYSDPYIPSTSNDIVSSGATFNADGSVSLENRYPTAGIGWFSGIGGSLNNSYIAFEGNYGVGTYIDFTFKGNNLPQVCLFANNINGNMSQGGATSTSAPVNNGYLLMNGLYAQPQNQLFYGDRLTVLGPHRMDGTINYNINWSTFYNYTISSNQYFTQNYLSADTSDITYKYTVGTKLDSDETVLIEVTISNADTNEVYKTATFDTNKTQAEVEALGSNIIVYGCVKGGTEATTFTYSEPHTLSTEEEDDTLDNVANAGATFNADGSVSLENRYPTAGIGWLSGISGSLDNSYIAFEGNYGVGTYIDFTFKGNNLPQVCLFANNINGNMSQGGASATAAPVHNGYLLMNGLYAQPQNQLFYGDRLTVLGPHRMDGTINYNINWSTFYNYTISSNQYFTQNYLSTDTSDITYKYTVGTNWDNDGTVLIEVMISNADTNEVYKTATFDTNKTQAEVEALGSNIIVYGCVKGGTEATTFTYSEPHTLPVLQLPHKGASLNSDGTITLEGVYPPHVGYGSGLGSSGVEDSYVAFEGAYGVGTYIDIEYTGNNMPYITLFSNTVDGYVGGGTEKAYKGITLINGIVSSTTIANMDCLRIWGPYRYQGRNDINASPSDAAYSLAEITDCVALTQNGLNGDYANTKFLYTVGTYSNGYNIGFHIILTDLTSGIELYNEWVITTLTEDDIAAGNIILHAPMKGNGLSSTFKYSQPYIGEAPDFCGATYNSDGSVTLKGYAAESADWESGISEKLSNSYISYNDEYILGTEVAFTFKGNNLPQVMLFADSINGEMSKLGGNGILLMNGLYSIEDGGIIGENVLACFGPNRIFENYKNLVEGKLTYDVLVDFEEGYEWKALEENTTYKYVVWTEEVDGKIIVCIELYNAVSLNLLSKGSYVTGISINDISAGAIVVYAAVKGDGNNTTFFYQEPKMHEDSMNFYTYGTPGTYEKETDLTTAAVLSDYVNSGLNTMVLAGESAFNGGVWSTSETKRVMDVARNAGVEKFIINDQRLWSGLTTEGSLIGNDCRFKSEAALDAYVKNCMKEYAMEEGFYGVILQDEPSYVYATYIGQLYHSIKRVAAEMNKDIYIQLNLLPLASDAWESYTGSMSTSMYNDYVSYLSRFLEETGADRICVDKYPFLKGGSFIENYYSCYQALAEACETYGAEFGFVLQSYGDVYVADVTEARMNLQMNAALAFGAKEIAFFTYVPTPYVTDSSETGSFVSSTGEKTKVYTYAQNAMAQAKKMEKFFADYKYIGSSWEKNDFAGIDDSDFENDNFALMTYSSSASLLSKCMVATESYNSITGTYLYTVINANAKNGSSSTVTMTFAGYTQAYVIVDGVANLVTLSNSTYTATLAVGEAVYIIPIA